MVRIDWALQAYDTKSSHVALFGGGFTPQTSIAAGSNCARRRANKPAPVCVCMNVYVCARATYMYV